MKTLNVKNSKGRTFNVAIINKGDAYGLDNCLTHEEVEPMVEFYDADQDPAKFGELGQFVSRYYVKTLLGGNARNVGLSLMGYEPVWTLYRPEMALVCDWVANQTNNA